MEILIYIFILGFIIKGSLKGNEKKITKRGIILVPILLAIATSQGVSSIKSMPNSYYLAFAIAIIAGALIGLYRSKFYSYRVNENGDVLYKRHIYDAIILIGFMLFEGLTRFIFKTYEANLFMLINSSLMFLATSSIATRRYIMYKRFTSFLIKKEAI